MNLAKKSLAFSYAIYEAKISIMLIAMIVIEVETMKIRKFENSKKQQQKKKMRILVYSHIRKIVVNFYFFFTLSGL